LFSNEVAIPKPSPEPLRRMMDFLRVTPDTCCYVGDSLSDVRMAQAAGVKILTVATGDHSRQELSASGAEWVADSLLELAAWIQNDGRL
jgi:phosphoglycolate phosphatase-like HAD superfamily hydrolase